MAGAGVEPANANVERDSQSETSAAQRGNPHSRGAIAPDSRLVCGQDRQEQRTESPGPRCHVPSRPPSVPCSVHSSAEAPFASVECPSKDFFGVVRFLTGRGLFGDWKGITWSARTDMDGHTCRPVRAVALLGATVFRLSVWFRSSRLSPLALMSTLPGRSTLAGRSTRASKTGARGLVEALVGLMP